MSSDKKPEQCRLSWFIVETDEGLCNGGNMNGQPTYKYIHAFELVDDDPTHTFVNAKVRFNCDNKVLDGRVLMAFDDQIAAKDHYYQLCDIMEKPSKKILVQYRNRSDCVLHAFLENEVIFPQNYVENTTVTIRETNKTADVLYICESNELMRNELDILKNRCWQEFLQSSSDNVDNSAAKYLLVQYSKSLSHVCYTIIDINCTIYNNLNVYPDIMVYFNKDGIHFQGIIIRKSNDHTELCNTLDMIANFISTQTFPITNSESAPPFGLRNKMLEKIDELSEDSSTSIESNNLDLKLVTPSTDFQRLRGGCRRKKCKSHEKKLEDSTKQPGIEKDQQEEAKVIDLYYKCNCGKVKAMSDIQQEVYRCECEECKERDLRYKPLPEVKNLSLSLEPKKVDVIHDVDAYFSKCDCKVCKENTLAWKNLPEVKIDEPKITETVCYCVNEPKKRKCRSKCKCRCRCNIFKRNRSPKNKKAIKQENVTTVCYCKPTLTPLHSETCSRIDNVEKQIDEMSTELSELRKNMLEPHDYFKIKYLSEKFCEVNELLMEVKINCSKMCNIQKYTNTLQIGNPLKDSCADPSKLTKLLEYQKYFVDNNDALKNRSTCSSNDNQHLLPLESGTNKPQVIQYNQNLNRKNDVLLENNKPNNQILKQQEQIQFPPGLEVYATNQQYNNNRRSSSGQESETPSPLFSDGISKESVFVELPVVTTNIGQSLWKIIGDYKSDNISITVSLESNHLYHINVSVIHTGQSLGCIYATETAVNQALTGHFFDNFLTFFVLNSNNSVQERHKMLNHSLGFMNSNK